MTQAPQSDRDRFDIIDEMINQLRKSPSAETDTFHTLIETVQALADEVRDLKRKIGTK